MVRSVYGLVHLRTCNSLKVSTDPLPSINAVDFGWARLRGKQDQDPLSLLFQTHWLAQRNPGPTLGKKRKWLRQGLLEPLLGLPFLSYRLDVRSTFTFVFSSRSMQDSHHRRSLCVWVRMRVWVFKDRRAAPLLQTVSWLLSRSMECHFSWTRSQLRGQTIPQQWHTAIERGRTPSIVYYLSRSSFPFSFALCFQTIQRSHTVCVTQDFLGSSPFGECVITRKARHQIALPLSE